jgi:integral membrane sensor domain MASE1
VVRCMVAERLMFGWVRFEVVEAVAVVVVVVAAAAEQTAQGETLVATCMAREIVVHLSIQGFDRHLVLDAEERLRE